MAEILEFPFDSGAYQAADRKWLPANLLAVAENVRLDRAGRLGVRPGATALGLATMSTRDMVPYDLVNYQGRLCALGSQTLLTSDRMTDLFEYLPDGDKWRSTSGSDTGSVTGQRLPTFTNMREVGTIPDQGDSVRHVSVAAGAGYVCAVTSRAASSTIHVFDPETDQTLLLETVALRLCRVVYAGSNFWIYGVDADEDIVRFQFNPSSDETLPSGNTLVANATVVVDLSASIFGTGTAVAWCTASSAEIETFDASGGSVADWQAVAAEAKSVALVGNIAGTLLSLAYQDGSSEYQISTFNAAGALQDGPTALFSGGGGSGVRLGAAMLAGDAVLQVVGVNFQNRFGFIQDVTQATHALGTLVTYHNARPHMAPLLCEGEMFSGWVDPSASDAELGTFHVVGRNQLPQCFLAQQQIETFDSGENVVSNGCAQGSKAYVAFASLAENTGLGEGQRRGQVVEAECANTARRQTAEVAGELLISGGLPLTYDGRGMSEIGFAECPIVLFGAESTAGSLTQLATYQVKAVWKAYNGRVLVARSQPSPPTSHTLTGANDAIQWGVTTPHSLRRHGAFFDQGFTVVVELYRTVANGANFQLDAVHVISAADGPIAAQVSMSSTQSDSTLRDNQVVYSDESGLEISAPEPCRFIWSARDRAFTGGLPASNAWLMSDLNIPGRQVSFPFARAAYTQRANQDITAVGAFETVGVVWSKDEIRQVPGRGPERSGTGEFDSMLGVPSPGGCIDWRSIVSTPMGFFFQMAPDMLMVLTRSQQGASAGEIAFVGEPVRDTLAAFPVVTAAVHIRSQMAVAFSCNNTDGDDGRILFFDLRRQQWFVDTVGGPVDALAELDGRLCWLSEGVVYQQDAAPGDGAFVNHEVQSGLLRITKALGWGHVYRIGLLGQVVGACTVEAFIDYDDGQGFRSLGTETITGPVGNDIPPLELFWSLPIQKTSRFAVRFVVTHDFDSAGLRLNGWAAEVEGSKNMVRVGSTGQVA